MKLLNLFSKRTTKDLSEAALSPHFRDQVRKAIQLLGQSEGSLDNKEVLQLFNDNSMTSQEAEEIMLFLPIAFVRKMLPNMKWPETYIELIGQKRSNEEKKYSGTKSFVIIWEETNDYYNNAPEKNTVLKIAGRSAEFHVINKLLLGNPGMKAEEIKLSKASIIRSPTGS
ncbi:hypothetical protein HB364_27655 [Pseudoflavitalea sp. X16]|uniref:hypothetical protein n=1 Tax=Paraflavitalea devenefica TaxID=2716334 RepID=UPI00141D783E|nr:hypothetical protein [Paraflavitalea devenefica]NII28885.1 hypothetical protein [Paraflavitalea devenefica]